ncbi:Na+/H+ antiporter, partial [Vibrio cholerae]|nr:Na+/H+ antiporter [Vibrio cholerae]
MNIVDYSNSFWAVLPPFTALVLAVVTRRVLFSLGMGIVLGALLLTQFSPLNALGYLQQKATALVWDDGALNWWNIHILLFLFLLGGMTAMLTLSGGSRAFAQWARQRIKTQRGAKLLTVFLGAFIFIDDYFNSLAVGSIARPVTDRAHISRAKLAYILDSTAAPVCVMMPASSWGAYIITIIGGILTTHGVTE